MQDLWSHGDIHSNRGLRDLVVCGMVRILVGKPERTMHTTVKVKLEREPRPLVARDARDMKGLLSKESSPIVRIIPRDLPFGLYQGKLHEWSCLSHLKFTPQHHVPLMMDLEFHVHACPPGF